MILAVGVYFSIMVLFGLVTLWLFLFAVNLLDFINLTDLQLSEFTLEQPSHLQQL